MIRLKRIKLSRFRSFNGENVLLFPERGLVQLKGINRNTGGSSGSGKSNLLYAIQYALGNNPAPVDKLQARGEGPKMSVELEVGNVVVARGKGKVGVAQEAEKLKKETGLTPALLAAMTYRPQRQRGHLLSLGDLEIKKFLCDVIPDLNAYETLAEEAAQNVPKLTAAQIDLEKKLAVAEARAILPTLPVFPTPSDASLLERTRVDISTALEAFSASLKGCADAKARRDSIVVPEALIFESTEEFVALQQKANVENLQLENAHKEFAAVGQTKDRYFAIHKVTQSELGTLREKLRFLQDVCARLPKELATKKTALEARISSLQSKLCPTCKRTWEDKGTEALLQTEVAALAKIHADMNDLVTMERDRVELVGVVSKKEEDAQQQLKEATDKYNAMVSEKSRVVEAAKGRWSQAVLAQDLCRKQFNEKHNSHVKKAVEELAAANAALGAVVATSRQAQERLALLKQTETFCLAQKQAHLEEVAKIQERHRALVAEQEAQLKMCEQLKGQVGAVKAQIAAEQDLADLAGTKGFLTVIFNEILHEIASETNALLSLVPNTSNVTLSFDTEVVSRGSRRIIPMVSVGGGEAVPPSTELSGGQLSTLELATDLGAMVVIGRRTGACPAWLLLDEPFDGLGPIEKEAYLELLSRYAKDRLVLIVDHSTDTNEFFEHSITVEMDGNTSRIL